MLIYCISAVGTAIEFLASLLHMLLNGMLCLAVAAICLIIVAAIVRRMLSTILEGIFAFRLRWALNTYEIERKKRSM